jgi:DivIVA domain-containing protein
MKLIDGTLGRGPLTGAPVLSVDVRKTAFRVVLRGYDVRQVDDTLSERIRELEARERGPAYRPRHLENGDRHKAAGFGSQWLVEWIRGATFSTTKLRPGYDANEVDAMLDRVVAGLNDQAPPFGSKDVREYRFTTVRLQPGYDVQEVDRFLDQLAAALDGLPPT